MPGPPARHATHAVACGDGGHSRRHRFCQPKAKRLCSGLMRTALLLLLALAASGCPAPHRPTSTVWKWVDEKGVTHYSDQPVPGATKIEVRAGNVADVALSASRSSTPPSATGDRRPTAPPSYRDFEIWRPRGRSVDHQHRRPGQRRDPHRAGAAAGAHAESLSRRQAGRGLPAQHAQLCADRRAARHAHVNAVITDQPARRFGRRRRSSSPCGRNRSRSRRSVRRCGRSRRSRSRAPANKMLTTQPSYGALNGAAPGHRPGDQSCRSSTKPAPKPRQALTAVAAAGAAPARGGAASDGRAAFVFRRCERHGRPRTHPRQSQHQRADRRSRARDSLSQRRRRNAVRHQPQPGARPAARRVVRRCDRARCDRRARAARLRVRSCAASWRCGR